MPQTVAAARQLYLFNKANLDSPAFTGNPSAPNIDFGYTTTATAAGTTTLVAGSNFQQFFTGTTTQNCDMPVASTLVLGRTFEIVNNSTGLVTVRSSGGNIIQAMAAGSRLFITCILISGTDVASWSIRYIPIITISPTTAYELLGGSIKAEPFGGVITNVSTNFAVSEARLFITLNPLATRRLITGVSWLQNIAGAYTADAYTGVGVYSLSAGTLTLLASSADDGNLLKATANTIGKKAFSATITLEPGIYGVAILYNYSAFTTVPRIGAYALPTNSILQSFDFTNSVKLNSYIDAQAALPSSQAMSGMTLSTVNPYLALY